MIHFFWTHVQSLTATKAWRHWIHITSESQLWSMPFDIIPPMAKLISLKKGQITQLMQREGAKAISVDEIWSLGFQWLWSVSCLNSVQDHAYFFASSAINIWQCVAITKLTSMLSKQSAQISSDFCKLIPALTLLHNDRWSSTNQIRMILCLDWTKAQFWGIEFVNLLHYKPRCLAQCSHKRIQYCTGYLQNKRIQAFRIFAKHRFRFFIPFINITIFAQIKVKNILF